MKLERHLARTAQVLGLALSIGIVGDWMFGGSSVSASSVVGAAPALCQGAGATYSCGNNPACADKSPANGCAGGNCTVGSCNSTNTEQYFTSGNTHVSSLVAGGCGTYFANPGTCQVLGANNKYCGCSGGTGQGAKCDQYQVKTGCGSSTTIIAE